MKQLVLLIVGLVCLVGIDGAHAQRALPKMRGIEIRGGMADGFHSPANRNRMGYYFGAAMSIYARRADKWVFGAEYLNRYHPYKDGRIPTSQFTAEGGYHFNFLSDGSKTVFFSVGGSALAGYETVNWGEKRLPDGATLRNRDRFIYGGAVTLEIETYLTDRIVLLLTGCERVLWGTTTGHFHTQFGVGLRFMID